MRNVLRAFCLCSAMFAASCLNGCSKADPAEKQNASVFQQTTISDYNITRPPDDGWDEEKAASVIELCGKGIKLPFTVGSLGDDFEFVEGTGCVSYRGHEAFIVAFVNNDKSGDLYETTVRKIGSFEQSSDDAFQNSFIINGIGIGSRRADVISAFGEPDEKTDTAFEYYSKHEKSDKYLLRFHFGEIDAVQSMFVNLDV